jgi:FtsP/CotA-like multicopper oxidase with cupredoxin domain
MKFLPTVIPLLVAVAMPTSAQAQVQVNYQPVELVSSGGYLEVTLDVGSVLSLNGTRIASGYNVINGATVGPTIRLKPGEQLKVILNNNLGSATDLDRELNEYVMDTQNNIDSYANVTTIYNRLDENGNIVSNSTVGSRSLR